MGCRHEPVAGDAVSHKRTRSSRAGPIVEPRELPDLITRGVGLVAGAGLGLPRAAPAGDDDVRL